MPSPEEYTVGWICAVTPELVAAKAVLDEEYGDPDHIPVNDNNNYTLGRIGKHHVVVAVMAHWQYGIANAAVAARDMVHSFPNVRIGLMVGIGGGAPSKKHDIRLGDVVVTSPGYSNGGVFQYDYGVTVQNGTFETTGFLNQPPLFVLSAISALKADYETHGHDIEKTIDSILQKNIRLQRKYRRPDASTDVLYESAFEHVGDDDSSCTVMCNGDTSNIVPRVERTEYDDNPTIHYGLIASGSQLVKNALLRDKLAAEKEVLCFEMEAAGLMNHFPCLVVRGICDYSDTHKNATWQRYAAMAAAAYVKDLLNKIAPNKVEAERNLREVFYELGEKMDDIKLGIENIQGDNHFAKLHAWLSPPDPSTNYSRALEYRHSGTGKWFLESRQYSSWKRKRNSFLWLNGKSGCGKTILASTIIEELQELEQRSVRPRRSVHSRRGVQSRRGVYSPRLLYFYFDFIDTKKQSLEFALRSLAIQLYCKVEKARSPLDSLYSDHRDRSRPATQLLQKTLNNMIKQAGSLWIIIDALDECVTRRESHSGKLFPWIESLRKAEMNVHLLVTSRPEQDIASNIRNWARNTEIVLLQGIAINEDIRTYIGARLSEGEMQRWRSELEVEQYIKNTLEKKADGMFRWVACQLDALESCLDPVDVQNALGSLPETLGETYLRILNDVPARYEQKTTRILQFLTYSSRPLQIEELVDAIAVQPTSRPRFDQRNRMPIPEEITRYCSGLVTTTRVEKYGSDHYRYHLRRDSDTEITIIQLAHSSVKEFLISDSNRLKGFSGNAARAMITEVCLSYLLHLGQEKSSKSTYQRIEGYPLANYAAQEWTSHAAAIEASSDPKMGVVAEFFESEDTMRLCNNIYPSRRWLDRLMDPLMFAVYYGLIYSAERLIKNGADVNANSIYGTIIFSVAMSADRVEIIRILAQNDMDLSTYEFLHVASSAKRWNMVKALAENGARVPEDANESRNPLEDAVRTGPVDIARMLLDKGAGASYYRRPLYYAASLGRAELVKELVEKLNDSESLGADVRAGCMNALIPAVTKGHQNIAEILLNEGAIMDQEISPGRSILLEAIQCSSSYIAMMMLNKGASVNMGRLYNKHLEAAIEKGHEDVIDILLNKGYKMRISDLGNLDGALVAAAKKGYESIAKELLEKGANVNCGSTTKPLYVAARAGHEGMVKLLTNYGAEVKDEYSWFYSFFAAAKEGCESVERLFIDNGATSCVEDMCDPLYTAVKRSHQNIVSILISKGADINRKGWNGDSLLHVAVRSGDKEMARFLIDSGIDVNMTDRENATALSVAADRRDKILVKLLLEQGVAVNPIENIKAENQYPPLHMAALRDSANLVRLLINYGADVNAQATWRLETPLFMAVRNGNKNIFKLLVDNGANVNARNKYDETPLQVAASRSRTG